MPQRLKWWHMLQAAKKEARLAVDLYNRSVAERSLEGFVLHMHIAWLYMLHARFLRDGVDFRYRKPNGHFERVDGEVKTWELARCVREEFPRTTTPCGTTSSSSSACATRSSTASRSCWPPP